MALKLEWEWNGGYGVTTAGGLRLVVRNCYHPVTWQIRSGAGVGVAAREVEVIDDDWRAATLAAQEAAEAAAARLLAEDEGVRALLGLRWIPVSERLPAVGQRVVLLRKTGTPFEQARVVSLYSHGWAPAWWDDCYGEVFGGAGDVWMEIPAYKAEGLA